MKKWRRFDKVWIWWGVKHGKPVHGAYLDDIGEYYVISVDDHLCKVRKDDAENVGMADTEARCIRKRILFLRKQVEKIAQEFHAKESAYFAGDDRTGWEKELTKMKKETAKVCREIQRLQGLKWKARRKIV